MGYRIPGADFTESAQLQINVADELGTAFASQIGQFAQAYQRSQAQAEKDKAVKKDFTSGIKTQMNEKINQTLEGGKLEYGKSSGDENNPSVYDQWSKRVMRMGKIAEQNYIDLRFGDYSQEEEAKRFAEINEFTNYTKNSSQNMGRLVADVNDRNKAKMDVRGDSSTGEQLTNMFLLEGIGAEGSNASYFGKGATLTKTLKGEGLEDFLNTKITIPTDSPFVNDLIKKSPGAKKQFQAALDNGYITLDEENGVYVINKEINVGAYGLEGGADFVIPEFETMQMSDVLTSLGAVKKGVIQPGWLTTANRGTQEVDGEEVAVTAEDNQDISDDTPVESLITTRDLPNNRVRQSEIKVFDMQKIVSDDSFKNQLKVGAGQILDSETPSDFENAMKAYGVISLDEWKKSFPGLDSYKTLKELYNKGIPQHLNPFVTEVVKRKLFSDTFKVFQKNAGAGDYNNMQIAKKGTALFKYLEDNNILNENGRLYENGDPVYVQEKITEQPKHIPGVGNIYDRVYKQYADNPTTENAKAIFSTPIKISGGKKDTFHLWIGDGVYVVDADGIKIGNQKEGLQEAGILSALARGKSK